MTDDTAGAGMVPEFSRRLRLEDIAARGAERAVEASAEECAALAERMILPSIAALRCEWRLTPEKMGRFLAEGRLAATLTQICVVSLEPFESSLLFDFTVRFVPAGTESDDEDPESIDEVPYEGDAIDLGEAAAEELALSLDPYPRNPDAVLPELQEEAPTGPFAALARLPRPTGQS